MTDGAAPRRVLWLIKGLGHGGAEQLLVEHASGSRRDGVTFEVAFVLAWKTALVEDMRAQGVPVHSLGVRRLADLRWTTRLRRLLRDGNFDVVHAHSPQVAAVARVLVRGMRPGTRPAFVFTDHNRWPSYRLPTRIANQLTYGLNDATLAVSGDVRDSVSARWRAGVEVVEHGIDLARVRAHAPERAQVRDELGARDDELLVITVANIRATKNYPGLLATARDVSDRGLPVRFAAAGQGPMEAEIRRLHEELGLDDRMQLLGYRRDSARLLAGADVFLLASHHEGLPLSMMEAFALGVPAVAPAVGGLRTAIVDGENGLLVPPGDARALADAVERALDPALRTHLAAGARASAERYSSVHAIARIDDLYRSVTSHTS